MAASNHKQALLPENSIRLDNGCGTAPGFALQHNRCWFVFVPGVPSEMKQMFAEQIKNQLQTRFILQADHLISIKTIGMGESEIQQQLNNFKLPENVQLSFRAAPSEVQTKLLFPANMAQQTINQCVDQLVNALGDDVFAVDNLNQSNTELIDVIDRLMKQKKYNLSLIETLTQGLIAAKCLGKDWLSASTYKQMINANKHDDIPQFAVDLAKHQDTDLTLIQLYQGEAKQFHDKNKAIVLYNVLITPHRIFQTSITVAGSIERKQNQAAIKALDFLRRTIQTDAFNKTQ
jgi:molybdopterin-biosynthesis enzyme MoeA-like protein